MKILATSLALLAVVAASPTAVRAAVITEYTDEATFLALLPSGYLAQDFSSFSPGDQGAPSLTLSGGTPPILLLVETRDATNVFVGDNLYVTSLGDTATALGASTDLTNQIRFSTPGLYAIGGRWFLSDLDENYVAGTVTLTFSDNSVFQVASTTLAESYRGFFSDSPLASVRVSGSGSAYVTFDNLAAVPEPGVVALLGLGGLLTLLRLRRRH